MALLKTHHSHVKYSLEKFIKKFEEARSGLGERTGASSADGQQEKYQEHTTNLIDKWNKSVLIV